MLFQVTISAMNRTKHFHGK